MAAMSLFTVACVEEEPVPYEPGQPDAEGCYGVYFPVQESAGAHTYDPNMPTEVEFTVARKVTKGAITVPIAYKESHEGIFNVPEAVFEDGQTETTIKVTFPTSGNGTNYKLSLAIEDPQFASTYQDTDVHLDFSVLRVEWVYVLNPQTNEPAKFTFTQGWWDEVHTGYVKYYEVDGIRTCQTVTDPVETKDGLAYGFWGTGEAEGDGEISFTWYTNKFDGNGKQVVLLPETPVYYHSTYEAVVHAYDWYTYFTVANPQAALEGVDFLTFVSKYGGSYATSYYDNGGFYFAIAYYYMIGIGGWSIDAYDVVCEAEGYTRVDYTLNVESDYCENGSVPVFFEVGTDVKSVNYVVAAGKVNSVDMAELLPKVADGTAENVVKVAEADMYPTEAGKEFALDLTCPASGQYTLVAVALDAEGKAQADASIVFDFVAADDDSQDVKFSVFAEKTHERYAAEGVTEYNSFAYTIYGGNATKVHVGVYDSATVEKYGEAIVISDVRASKYALGEEALAAVNTLAGYSDIVSGLKDGTSYTLVVWATNGVLTKAEFVEFTTTKNPEKFQSLGMALYTEDYLAGLFTGMECLTYEVEIEESLDNPGKYRLVNPYGAAFPYNEPGDYDDSQDYYLVINAQDPNGVFIPEQSVGCDWGYGEWVLYSYAAYYMDNMGATLTDVKAAGMCGTLVDGVITFPESALLITASGLGGQYYNGNSNGAFKVVLPSARGAEGDAEGTETTSVKSTSISADATLKAPMTVGHSTGIDYNENIVTVSCEAAPSQAVKKNVTRNSSIEKISATVLR